MFKIQGVKTKQIFGEVATPATDPKECLNSLTEVQSVRVFWHIKIISIKGDILQSNAFHDIWQQVPPPPPLPLSPPYSHLSLDLCR